MSDVTLTWEWENAATAVTVFDDTNSIRVLDGVAGHDMPPRNISEARLVGVDGSVPTNRRFESRDVIIPVSLFSTGSVTDVIGTLATTFVNGPGKLRYTTANPGRPTPRTRELRRVEYMAGLEGDMRRGDAALDYLRQVPIGFRAFDPWWYGETESLIVDIGVATPVDYNDAAVDYNDITVPYAGGSDTVIVDGAEAYTVVTFTGPLDAGASLSIVGGNTLTLASALAGGATVTVESRPLNRGPRLNGGAIDFALLTPESALFDLPNGTTTLTFSIAGTTAASEIRIDWTNRYLTP